MSKSVKMGGGDNVQSPEAKSGFYVYSDGHSHWGINFYRFGEVGVECTEEIHQGKIEDKMKFYNLEIEKRVKAEKEKQEKEKAKEKN